MDELGFYVIPCEKCGVATGKYPCPICTKQEKIDIHYLRIAAVTALNLSKDPSTKVGAVIVSSDGKKLSTGYNGFPAGTRDDEELYLDRENQKLPRVLHAELNAILNCPFDKQGCAIYSTLKPCYKCLGAIINSGITRVVWYAHPTHPRSWDREDILNEWLAHVEWKEYIQDPLTEKIISIYNLNNKDVE